MLPTAHVVLFPFLRVSRGRRDHIDLRLQCSPFARLFSLLPATNYPSQLLPFVLLLSLLIRALVRNIACPRHHKVATKALVYTAVVVVGQ